MDNKITKSRLSSFFTYEWLKILIFFIIAVIILEFVFAFMGVKLSYGQRFKVIYDQNIDDNFDNNLIKAVCVDGSDKSLLSYEVQDVGAEVMASGAQNTIQTRYETYDGDVVITDNREVEGESIRVKFLIDYFNVWSFEKALLDGEEYLSQFLKDQEAQDKSNVYDFEKLDLDKIDQNFLQTHEKDNRFRSQKNKQKGILLERERIANIVSDMCDIRRLLQEHPEIFYTYTRYEQTILAMDVDHRNYQEYKQKYDNEKPQSYAIVTDNLTNGEYKVADFLTCEGKPQNVLLFAFDFYHKQQGLQFESLRFFTLFISKFSNFLD